MRYLFATLVVSTGLMAIAAKVECATIVVAAGGSVQRAIDDAQPGDTILLQAGATFSGTIVLPNKSGNAVITIRSSASDAALPPAGSRIDPSYAPVLPKLRSGSSMPALMTAAGAHDYNLAALEFLPNAAGAGDIIELGDGSSKQLTLAAVPHDIVLDRVYIHGDAASGQKRAIALNSASTAIVNSYIADIKAVGQDSQAICGWNGPGPFTITNNYLEAAGENVMFGGSDPSIPNLVPSDITFRNNDVAKQPAWRTQAWSVKNIFELKNAQRVIVDHNTFAYNWLAAQAGYAIVFTPRNQSGTAPWSVVQHVQFTNNVVRHVSSVFNVLGTDNLAVSQVLNDIVIHNNVFDDVSAANWGGSGRMMQIGAGPVDVVVDHNTSSNDGSSTVYAYGAATQRFVFTNNIIPDNHYALMGDGTSPGNATIAKYFGGSQFQDSVFAGSKPSLYPSGNYFPLTMAAVGFVDPGSGNYRLLTSSPYHGAATDGTDVGCDFNALTASGAVNDPWTPGINPSGIAATGPTLLLQNDVTRQVTAWHMGGAQGDVVAVSSALHAGVPGWRVVGRADFNGDGIPDLVWQNDSTRQVTVMYMLGAEGDVVQSWKWIAPNALPGWKVVAIADLNGDAHPDLVWQNDATRQVTAWFLGGADGSIMQSWTWVEANGIPGWTVVAAGDFNADGHPDLVWENDATGQVTAWLMGGVNGSKMLSWTWIYSGTVTGWRIAGSADFDGDGHPDLAWQNTSTRQIIVWYMSAGQSPSMLSREIIPTQDMVGWTVVER